MEHYSRDKVILRVLNTVLFIVLVSTMTKYSFFNGDESLIRYIDINYYMAPFKVVYAIGILCMIFIFAFVIVQVDSSSHGIKKKVIENYHLFIAITFAFMSAHIYFLSLKSYKMSIFFVFLTLIMSSIVYIKSQMMKKYMYSDEVKIFVYPFSILSSWTVMVFFMTINIAFTGKLVSGSNLFVIVGLLELVFLLGLSIPILYFYKDRLFVTIQVIYLLALATNTYINGYFMPIGYLCFLSIVLIIVFWVKAFKRENRGR